jgi:hypothetical protein
MKWERPICKPDLVKLAENKLLLYKKAIHVDKEKIAWLSYADIATYSRKSNEKHINLGIAHGISTLVLFFCKLKEPNFQHKYLDELLIKNAITFYLWKMMLLYISHTFLL